MSCPGKVAFKHLLLMTIFCHYYSWLVTSAHLNKGICADIAANKSVNFFVMGFNLKNRLLITAKPDYLVYELTPNLVEDNTINLYDVKPVPFKDKYPALFQNEQFAKLIDSPNSSDVKAFTIDYGRDYPRLTMIFPDSDLLVAYTMGSSGDVDVVKCYCSYLTTQKIVSSRDTSRSDKSSYYSFLTEHGEGSRRFEYAHFDNTDSDMSLGLTKSFVLVNYTCKVKTNSSTLVVRSSDRKCSGSYDDWNWTESPKGWAYGPNKTNIHFLLFDDKQQLVYIFDQNDQNTNIEGDVFSVVRQKSYKDFFWCHSGTPPTPTSPTTPTTPTSTVPTSTTVNASTEVTKQTTTPVPTTPPPLKEGICADIAANKSVDFFLVGFHQFPYVRLLITARPDFLVYELYENMIDEDTINIYGVTPIPLKDYYPELFQNKKFVEAFDSHCDVKTYTIDIGGNWCHFSIFFPGFELLIRYLLDVYIVKENDDFNPPISTTQQFVSSRDYVLFQDQKVYSFWNEPLQGPILMEYKIKPDITPVKYSYTCKANQTDTIVWHSSDNKKCPDSYDDEWDWTESPKGWARRSSNANIRFHLFSRKKQQVYIFDKDDRDVNSEGNVFSVVRKRSYKDFFWCFSGNPTPAPTQPSTTTTSTTKITKRTTTVKTTSAKSVANASSTAMNSSTPALISSSTITTNNDTSRSTARTITSTEKPSSTIWWIIVLILVFLVVVITIVVFLVWYYFGSEKAPKKTLQFESSDEKFDEIAFKESSKTGGKSATSVVTSNVLSTQVIPSKVVASNVKAHKLCSSISQIDAKSKLSSVKSQTKGGANFVGSKEKSAIATKQVSGIGPTGSQLNVKSEAASTISIQSSIMDNSKGFSAQM